MIARSLLVLLVLISTTFTAHTQVYTAIPIWSPNYLDLPNITAFDDGTMVRTRRLNWVAKEKYFLLRSTDNGSTWKQVDSSYRLAFRYLVKANEVLYALDRSSKPFVSTDKGQSWTQLPLPPGYPADTTIALQLMSDGRKHAILYSDYGIWRLNSSAPWYSVQVVSKKRIYNAKPIMDGTIIAWLGEYYVVRNNSDSLETWASFESDFSETGYTPIPLDGQLWLLHKNGDGYVLDNGVPVLVKRAVKPTDRVLAQYVDDDIVVNGLQFYYRDRPDSVFSTYDVVANGAPNGKFTSSFVAGGRRFLNYEHHVFEITSIRPLVLTERWYSGSPKSINDDPIFSMNGVPNGTLISNNSPQMTSFTTSVDGGLSWHSYSTDSIIRYYLTFITIDKKGTLYAKNFDLCSLSTDHGRSFQATEGPICSPWLLRYQHYDDGSLTYNDNEGRYFRIHSDRSTVQELPLLANLNCCIANPTTTVRFRPDDPQRFELSTDDGASWQHIATLQTEDKPDTTLFALRRINDQELAIFITPLDRHLSSTAWLFDVDTRQISQIYRGIARPHDIIRPSSTSLRLALENTSIYEVFSDGTSRLHVDPILGVTTSPTNSRFRLLHTDGITYMYDQFWYHVIRLGPSLDVTSTPHITAENTTTPKIYPNPATSTFTIESHTPVAKATIRDLTGAVIMSSVFAPSDTPTTASLNVSDLASGMFMVMVHDDMGQTFTVPLWIMK